jgi:hypothetical protein
MKNRNISTVKARTLMALDVLDESETAHAERPGQHGDESAELVAKKVLHQGPGFIHA